MHTPRYLLVAFYGSGSAMPLVAQREAVTRFAEIRGELLWDEVADDLTAARLLCRNRGAVLVVATLGCLGVSPRCTWAMLE